MCQIVIGAFGTITKGLLKGLEESEVGGRVETIHTTALLRTARIPETSPGDLRILAVTQTPVEKSSANTDVKNSKGVNNNHKKKRTCKIVDFAVPADHRIKLKERL